MAQLHMMDETVADGVRWAEMALVAFEGLDDRHGQAHVLNTLGFADLIGGSGAGPDPWARLKGAASILRLPRTPVTRWHGRTPTWPPSPWSTGVWATLQRWCALGLEYSQARDYDMYEACLRIRAGCGLMEQGDWQAARRTPGPGLPSPAW